LRLAFDAEAKRVHKKMNKLKEILIWPWPLWSCLISGGLAEALHCPEIWGGGNRFISYAIPFPVASGTFHIPALLITTWLLYAQVGTGRKWPVLTLSLLAVLAIIFVGIVAAITRSSDAASKQVFVWLAADPILATVLAAIIRKTKAQHGGGQIRR